VAAREDDRHTLAKAAWGRGSGRPRSAAAAKLLFEEIAAWRLDAS